MPAFVIYMFFLGGLLGADSQGYGPEALCHVMGGEYKGYAINGHGGKEATPGAKVPYCTAGPSTLVEQLLKDKGVID